MSFLYRLITNSLYCYPDCCLQFFSQLYTVELPWYCYNFTCCLVEVAFNLLIQSRCLHKVFMWKRYSAYCYQCFMQLKLFFSQVTFAKPKSSRNSSIGKPSLLKGEWVNMYLLYVCLFSYMTHVIFVALLIFWCYCLFGIDNIFRLMGSVVFYMVLTLCLSNRGICSLRELLTSRGLQRERFISPAGESGNSFWGWWFRYREWYALLLQ